jgi:hypothetical protein
LSQDLVDPVGYLPTTPQKQAEKLQEMVANLKAKGEQGWELLSLHSFELVGGITGSTKGTTRLTIWKREVE